MCEHSNIKRTWTSSLRPPKVGSVPLMPENWTISLRCFVPHFTWPLAGGTPVGRVRPSQHPSRCHPPSRHRRCSQGTSPPLRRAVHPCRRVRSRLTPQARMLRQLSASRWHKRRVRAAVRWVHQRKAVLPPDRPHPFGRALVANQISGTELVQVSTVTDCLYVAVSINLEVAEPSSAGPLARAWPPPPRGYPTNGVETSPSRAVPSNTPIAVFNTRQRTAGSPGPPSGSNLALVGTATPYDNAKIESFVAAHKRECVSLATETGGYTDAAHTTADFVDYVDGFHNRHGALDYKTPLNSETYVN